MNNGETASTSSIYGSLNPAAREIRLLRIEPGPMFDSPIVCTLYAVSLDDEPSYECLSYVWGNQDHKRVVTVNNFEMPVGDNLELAMRRVRRTDRPLIIWIDALSINQKDITERNSQVRLMDRIYSQATIVYAWLGPADQHTIPAFDLIGEWTADVSSLVIYGRNLVAGVERSTPKDWLAKVFKQHMELLRSGKLLCDPRFESLDYLYRRPFWKRVWVQQELFLAAKVVLKWGESSLPLNRLVCFHSAFRDIRRAALQNREPEVISDVVQHLRDPSILFFKTSILNFIDCLGHIRFCNALDPRDKVYGILGMYKGRRVNLTVDYSASISTIYSDLVRTLVQDARILFLDGSNGIGEVKYHPILPNLPSWAPDLRYSRDLLGLSPSWEKSCWSGPLGSATPELYPSHDTRVLLCSGYVFDSITSIARFPGTIRQGDVLWNFIKDHIIIQHPKQIPIIQALFRSILSLGSDTQIGEPANFQLALGFIHWFLISFQNDVIPMHPDFETFCQAFALDEEDETDPKLLYILRFLSATGVLQHLYDPCKRAGNLNALLHVPACDLFRGFWGNRPWLRDIPNIDPSEFKLDVLSARFLKHLHESVNSRSLFVTDEGYIGRGPLNIEQGDEVVVLPGCRVPVVARRIEGSEEYEVVGVAFVYGLMDGEVVKMAERRNLSTRILRFI